MYMPAPPSSAPAGIGIKTLLSLTLPGTGGSQVAGVI
jgi:hypothetical protein